MRPLFRFLLILALCIAPLALANEILLGVITATTGTAKNQSTTSSSFTIPAGARVVIDCVDGSGNPANAYLAWYTSSSTSVAAGTFSRMTSFWETPAGTQAPYLSVLGVSATVNCHVSLAYP